VSAIALAYCFNEAAADAAEFLISADANVLTIARLQ